MGAPDNFCLYCLVFETLYQGSFKHQLIAVLVYSSGYKGCWVDLSAVFIDILISSGQQAGSRELRVDYLRLLLLRLHGFANVIVKTYLD